MKRYVPRTIGELRDRLGAMMLTAPTFKCLTGEFPDRDIETEFQALNGALENVRRQLGEDRYREMLALSDRMRTHFEVGQQGDEQQTLIGRELIVEMRDGLTTRGRADACNDDPRRTNRAR